MKTKLFTRTGGFLSVLAACGLLFCCSNDHDGPDGPDTGERALITVTIQSPGGGVPATRSLTEDNESDVKELDVLLFAGADGKYVLTRHCDENEITSTGTGNYRYKTFTVEVPQGIYYIMILANATDILSGAGSLDGLTYMQAMEIFEVPLPSADGKWPLDGSEPFPMWSVPAKVTFGQSGNLAETIQLMRMVARVDVEVTAANFKLSSVRVYNYNDAGMLAPNLEDLRVFPQKDSYYVARPNRPLWCNHIYGPLVYTDIDAGANSLVRNIYMFEAENVEPDMTLDLIDRTCLVIGGVWDANGNGDFSDDSGETFYRVEFSTGNGSAPQLLNVLRNHHYTFRITKVECDGHDDPETAFLSEPANITTEIITWNDGDMEDVQIEGGYYFSVGPLNTEHLGEEGYYTLDDYIKVKTNYKEWTFEISDLPTPGDRYANPANVGWLVLKDNYTPGTKYPGMAIDHMLYYGTYSNTTGQERKAYIHISGGKFTATVTITQPAEWIKSIGFDRTGQIPASGDIRMISVKGRHTGLPVRAWNKTQDHLVKEDVIQATGGSSTNSGMYFTIPELWDPTDHRYAYDMNIDFQYKWNNEWISFHQDLQQSYWLDYEFSQMTDDMVAPGGAPIQIKIWGNFPDTSFGIVSEPGPTGYNDFPGPTIVENGYISKPYAYSFKVPVPPFASTVPGDKRTILFQYMNSSTQGDWYTIGSWEQQAMLALETYPNRIVAMESAGNNSYQLPSNRYWMMPWNKAMGIDSRYSDEQFNEDPQNYTPTSLDGCGGYYEGAIDDPKTGRGRWRLPTISEMQEIEALYRAGRLPGHWTEFDENTPVYYWTSETQNYSASNPMYYYRDAYVVVSPGGQVQTSAKSSDGSTRARCVRFQ